ncbi:MAG: hypothetical protein WC716_09560 [Chitinophagaceae bacterium]|jgi:hypothetical protein
MKRQFYFLAGTFVVLLLAGGKVQAQSKIKDGSISPSSSLPNVNAILELESNKRGFLMPRIALQSTTLAAPLSAHIAGMVVYNTATVMDVSPGYYYNDGTAWRKLAYTTGGAGNDLTNANGIIVTGGTGASLKATSLRLDSSTVAKMMMESPVKDSAIKVVTTSATFRDSVTATVNTKITDGSVTGQDLTNANGIIVTGGTGTSLKATSLRLDSSAVAKMIMESPVKDSIAKAVTTGVIKDSIVKTMNGSTTNTLGSASNAITSTVNGVSATLTPASGTIASGSTLGFDASGKLVKGLGNSPDSTTASNGLSLSGKDVRLGGTLSQATAIEGLTASNALSINGTGVNMFNIDTSALSVDGTNNRVGIGTVSPGAKLEIASGTSGVSGLKFSNSNASSPIGVGQTLGVDTAGNVVTLPNASAATVTTYEKTLGSIGTVGSAVTVGDAAWTAVTASSQTFTVPSGGKAVFLNFMMGIDFGLKPTGYGQGYYTAALVIDGTITNTYQTVAEDGPTGYGVAQYNLSTVKFLTAGSHTVIIYMRRTTNNGTTSGEHMYCYPTSLSFNATYLN